MSLLEQYIQRSQDIIGDRTPEEAKYDEEVVKWLKKYGKIRKALNKANKKFPEEALTYNDDNIGDIESHYDYLMKHMEIMSKIGH
jgi:GH35 family endo-1,4-beta-xylanase